MQHSGRDEDSAADVLMHDMSLTYFDVPYLDVADALYSACTHAVGAELRFLRIVAQSSEPSAQYESIVECATSFLYGVSPNSAAVNCRCTRKSS